MSKFVEAHHGPSTVHIHEVAFSWASSVGLEPSGYGALKKIIMGLLSDSDSSNTVVLVLGQQVLQGP